MPGLKICRRNDPALSVFIILAAAVVFALPGCKGSEDTDKDISTSLSKKEFISKYEKTFDPADYDPDVAVVKAEEKKQHSSLEGPSLLVVALPETIPGFRIQVFLTQDIDEANSVRDSLLAHVIDEWTYVIYDSPYYKVRVGDYPDHSSAGLAVRRLTTQGFRDAWVVPDKVLKNPPPRLPDIQVEPQKPLDQHH